MKKTKSAPISTAGTQNDLYVIAGEAEKINPHFIGLLHWEMIESLDRERGLRIMTNDSGDLFSREWITLNAISGVLRAHEIGDFIPTTLHPLFTSASRNSAGFLAAVLHCIDICLTKEGSGGTFSHHCYPDWERRLGKLLTFSPSTWPLLSPLPLLTLS